MDSITTDKTAYRVGEIAARWDVEENTVRRMIDNGELRAFRAGRLLRVPAAEVIRIETGDTAA